MKIAIASDHGGFKLKEALIRHLEGRDIQVIDLGCSGVMPKVDYPEYAKKAALCVVNGEADLCVMIDGAGVGSTMVANKVAGVRAALCNDLYSAWNAREHNNANMLCMGSMIIGSGKARQILDRFIDTPFAGGRHERRVEMVNALDAEKSGGIMDSNTLKEIIRQVVAKVMMRQSSGSDSDTVSPTVIGIFSEKVLTEDYLKRNNIKSLKVAKSTIILPMAKDYINEKKVNIERV